MMILTVFAGIFLTSFVVMGWGLMNAPEGYEDESGFHLVWCNNAPNVADVVCIWAIPGLSAFGESVEIRAAA